MSYLRTFHINANATKSNVNTDRDNAVFWANQIKDYLNRGDMEPLVLPAPQGSGKTRSIAKQSKWFLDNISTDEKGANYIITSPTPSATSIDTALYLESVIQDMLDEGVTVIYFSSDKKAKLTFKYSLNYRYTNDMEELVKLRELNPSAVVIINSSHQTLNSKKNSSLMDSVLSDTPSLMLIDEFDWYGLGITTGNEYVKQNENGINSYSDKTFKLFSKWRNEFGVKMVGYTGTPTQEQKFNVDSFTIAKQSNVIASENFKELSGIYYHDFSLQNLNDIKKINDINSKDSGAVMIKSARGDISYIIKKVRNKNWGRKELTLIKSWIFYTSKDGAFTITPSGKIKTVGKKGTLKEAQELISKGEYDTLVVIEAGQRGFDLPIVNKTIDCSYSNKKEWQTTAQQFYGRGTRAYGDLEQMIYTRKREGSISALNNYNDNTNGVGTRRYFKMQEMISNLADIELTETKVDTPYIKAKTKTVSAPAITFE